MLIEDHVAESYSLALSFCRLNLTHIRAWLVWGVDNLAIIIYQKDNLAIINYHIAVSTPRCWNLLSYV